MDPTVKEGRFQGDEVGNTRKTSPEEVEGNMSRQVDGRALQEDLQSLGFTSCLAKPEMEQEVGRQRAHS